MDGRLFLYKELLRPNSKIIFETNCENSKEYTLPHNNIWVRHLKISDIHVILGLSFLLKDDGGVTLNKNYLHFHRHTFLAPVVSSLRIEKRGGEPLSNNPVKVRKRENVG